MSPGIRNFLIVAAFSLTAVFSGVVSASPDAPTYKRLVIEGETSASQSNPSITFDASGTGWMVYSSVQDGDPKKLSVHLAKSTDSGKSWAFVKEIYAPEKTVIKREDGTELRGYFVNEMPEIANDRSKPNEDEDWSLYTYRIFVTDEGERKPEYSWVQLAYLTTPDSDIVEETALFGTEKYPEPPYEAAIDLNFFSTHLMATLYYDQPGGFFLGKDEEGSLYLTLVSQMDSGPYGIVLYGSGNGGYTWNIISVPLNWKDAQKFGYHVFSSADIAEENGKTYLLVTPQKENGLTDGVMVFQFADIRAGTLVVDQEGKPDLIRHIKPAEALATGPLTGQGTYDEHSATGLILTQALDGEGHFGLFSTGDTLVPRSPAP